MASFPRAFLRQASSLASARVEASTRMLQVTWEGVAHDGRLGVFPVTWLRDNCQCPECYHASSSMRLLGPTDFDPRISPNSVKVAESKNTIEITWPNDHTSSYESDWLMSRDFGRHGHQFNRPRNSPLEMAPKLWGCEMAGNLKTYTYQDFLSDDRVLYDWLVAMEEDGIATLTAAPPGDEGVMRAIGSRVAHLKTTNYGTEFRVESKENPSNAAYTTGDLPLHCDLPYYHYQPGVQLLHFVRQSEGMETGANVFVDGLTAAEDLRREDPEAFRVLTDIPIDYVNKGTDYYKFHLHCRRPVIVLDEQGKIASVSFNFGALDSVSHVAADMVQSVYDALAKLNSYFYDKRNLIELKMKEGVIIAFHNRRVLHGRKAFEVMPGRPSRLLVGGYIDWDEMRSRRRVLAEELAI